jgi:ankyrin repeat protein
LNLESAISTQDTGVVNDILMAGEKPNPEHLNAEAKALEDEGRRWKDGDCPPRFDNEVAKYPLHFAASVFAWRYFPKAPTHEVAELMMKALLAHGADPYAIFSCPIIQEPEDANYIVFPGDMDLSEIDYRGDSKPNENGTGKIGPDGKLHGLRSLIHALLEDGDHVASILKMPDLKVDHRDPQGRTLLHSACLSVLGADAGLGYSYQDIVFDPYWPLPTEPFADEKAPTALTFLLERGADPMAVDNRGATVIHHLLTAHDWVFSAGWRSRPPKIRRSLRLMLSRYPELINRPDRDGTFPLHAALQRLMRYREQWSDEWTTAAGLDAVVDELLEAGADAKVVDGRGNTALHYLATGLGMHYDGDGYRRLFRKFLHLGLDITAMNHVGRTAASVFLDDDGASPGTRGNGWMERNLAIDQEILQCFDTAGMDWKTKDARGRTLAHVVAQHGTFRDAPRLQYLLDKGVDIAAEDEDGRTALDYAAICSNDELAMIIREHMEKVASLK